MKPLPEGVLWQWVKAGSDAAGKVVFSQVSAERSGDRKLRVKVHGDQTNRNGAKLVPNGWVLEHYLQNPVVLWNHQWDRPPVGRTVSLTVTASGLEAEIEFLPAGLSQFADQIWALYENDFMNGVSPGWLPLEWQELDDGSVLFTKMDLLEISLVNIPADPTALRIAEAKGLDVSAVRYWASQLIDEPRYVLYHDAATPGDTLKEIIEEVSRWHQGARILALPKTFRLARVTENGEEPVKEVTAGVVPKDVSTETAPENEAWEAPALSDFTDTAWEDLSRQEKTRIAGHFAYSINWPPAAYSDLKLPHHRPSDGKVVWRGVAAAMQRLSQADIPDDEKQRVWNHLAAHYKQFDREPPELSASAKDGVGEVERTREIAALRLKMLKLKGGAL